MSIFCTSWCRKTLKRSSEGKSWDTRLHKFGPNWAQIVTSREGNFLGKLTNNSFAYCMSSYYISRFLESESWDITAWDINCIIEILGRIGHKSPTYPYRWCFKKIIFFYFRYPITILQCLKKYTHVKKVGHTSEFLFGIYWWTWKTSYY